MAMEGHARQLEQYAELQEKHIVLLGKNRKIREGLVDLKKLAKKAGVTSTDTRWFECQAEQLVAMRIDHELERDAAKDEAAALQAQLQDTAEAVSAAGELLVRLKEAEEAVCMAQVRIHIHCQDRFHVLFDCSFKRLRSNTTSKKNNNHSEFGRC